MNIRNNQRHQETDRLLREALLDYMNHEKAPTVGQLCDAAGINRSTFYRHYCDVYDLMEQTEAELQKGLAEILTGKDREKKDTMIRMLEYIQANKGFYKVYLQKNIEHPLEAGFERVWEEELVPAFHRAGVFDERRMQYYYQFVRAGVTQVLRVWIDDGCRESTGEIASIINAMLKIKNRKE